MSLPRHRLRDAQSFDAVFKGNRYRVSSRAFLFLALNNQLEHSRLGMVIGKKHVKLATRRNRIKRGLREIFRSTFTADVPAIDLVVVARPGVETRDKSVMNEQISDLMNRLLEKVQRGVS